MDRVEFGDLIPLLQRADILSACREGAVDRTTICELADCSRATAYRATADLEERGLLERHDGGYRVTTMGAVAVEQSNHFRSGIRGAKNIHPVLKHVNEGELFDSMHTFADAAVFEADPSAPYTLEQRLQSIIDETETRLVGATASYSSAMVTRRSSELLHSGIDVQHIITPSALENVRAQSDENTNGMDFDGTAMYVVKEISLDLLLFDDTLVVPGPDDETGALAAMAVTENPSAVSWAQYHMDRHRDLDEPLEG